MTKYFIICFLFFTAFFYGCSNKSKKIDFKKVSSLKGEPLLLDFEFKQPTKIGIADSILVVGDAAENKCLVLINTNTNKFIHIGSKGEGPGEILVTWTIDFDKSRKNIWVYDPVKRMYNVFNIDSIYGNKDYKPKQIAINIKQGMPIYFQIIDSLTYLATGIFKDGIFDLYNAKDSVSKFYGIPSKLNKNESNEVSNQAFSYLLTYNKLNKKIAITTQNADQLLIFDSLYNKTCDIRTSGNIDPIYTVEQVEGYKNVRFSRKSLTGYMHINSTSNYIYGLFSGRSSFEAKGEENQANIVNVFDWTGKPVCQYTLDRRIICFAVDDKDNWLYGVAYDNEKPEIVKFKL